MLAVLLLTGCGFKLRGQAQLPPQLAVTYIKSTPPTGAPPTLLVEILRQLLEANKVKVTTEPTTASATLEILSEEVKRRALATNRSGGVREYTLTCNVSYRVALADGTALLPASSLSVFRDLLYSEADVLGKDEGEQIALQDMLSDIARSILLRLEVLGRKS